MKPGDTLTITEGTGPMTIIARLCRSTRIYVNTTPGDYSIHRRSHENQEEAVLVLEKGSSDSHWKVLTSRGEVGFVRDGRIDEEIEV